MKSEEIFDSIGEISIRCVICDESIPLNGFFDRPMVCNKCKAAIMKVRAEIDEEQNDCKTRNAPGLD